MPTPISEFKPQIVSGNEHFLLYGEPGMSKTFTALTIPEPIYFLSCGSPNELKTYYSKDFQDKHGKKEIYVDVAKENYEGSRFKDAVGFSQVEKLLDIALERDASGKGPQFRSIIIDNATQVIDFQLNRVTEISYMGVKDESGSKADKTAYSKYAAHGIFAPQDTDYGGAQSIMRKWQSWMMGIPKHFVFVAHEYIEEKKVTRHESVVTGIFPLFIGQDRERISNYFDNVWRMQRAGNSAGGQMFAAQTIASGNPTVIAKTRIGGLFDRQYLNPDLTKVIEKFAKHTEGI